MKKITLLTKMTCFALVGAALLAAPAISRAEDATNAPAAQAPAPKKHGSVFHGKVAAVDANAMTFTIGDTTAVVSSTTKIFKDGKPAVFADITVGENVICNYKKDDAGKYNASVVRIVPKKKAAAATDAAPAAPATPGPGQ
jgi:hypothetical protein